MNIMKVNIDITLDEFDKICRLCLACGDLRPLLDVQVVDVLKSITNIEVKDDDQLPENICAKCVKQLEDISLFIGLCKSNDESLRLLALSKQWEHSGLDQDHDHEDDDNDNVDDTKHESTENLSDVKEEIVVEPDVTSLKAKTSDNEAMCELCKEVFNTKVALIKHYENCVLCGPNHFDGIEKVQNILEFLDKKDVKKTPPNIKEEEEEPEYVNGKKLKGERKYLCSYCGKNYTRKNGLDRHMLSHTGIKPFECKECGKRYITKDTLKTHLLTHTGVKAHKCKVCNKSFVQSSHLRYHMRRHAGDKPHICMFCGKAFLSTYHLERHKLMHTGVKPYTCNQCGKQFVRSTTLRDHLLIHSGEKPFQCQHCGKQFTRKQLLTNHILVHTYIQIK